MTLQDYLKLKNGTDVRGIAAEGVAGFPAVRAKRPCA